MLCRHVATGDVQDLNEDHSATLAWLAAGTWVPVESEAAAVDVEVVETPERPKRRGRHATADRPETR